VTLLLLAPAIFASEHTGVVKFTGLPVPGVTITATQGDKTLTAVTDVQGVYRFPDLADGTWKFHVAMLCFTPIDSDVIVSASAPPAVWDLKLLSMSEIQAVAGPEAPKLAVSAAPPPEKPATPAPAAPQPSGLLKRSKKAPVPAANPQGGYQRASLNASGDQPKPSSDAAPPPPPEASQGAVDGFLVNGSVNNGAASPFAQSGAFGNNRRGGRSLWNGGIGLKFGDSVFDARPYSLTGQDTPKPSYSYFQGSANVGGPIKIPHITNGVNSNFFLGYQWLHNTNATTQSALMPDAASRNGELSTPAIDPATGAPFPGNIIPASRISSQATALLALYPLPNIPGNSHYNFQVPISSRTQQDSFQGRANKAINPKNMVMYSLAFQRTSTGGPNLFGFYDHTKIFGITTTLSYNHRFTNHLFGTPNFTFSRQVTTVTPYFANQRNISAEAGITGNNQDPVNWGPPSLSFSSGIAGLSDVQSSSNRNQTAALGYSMFWNHRAHNVTFGGDYKRQQFNALSQQNPRGTFTFTSAGTGYDFANFLLGFPNVSSIAYGNADKYFRSSLYDAFFTDDWRINSSFSLNAGARWEYGSPVTELYGRLVNLDFGPGFSAAAPVVAQSPTGPLTGMHYPDSLVHPDKSAIQPRIGIAWRPLPASSLVVRAGYGIYYNTSVYQTIASQMAQQSPLSTSFSVQNSAQNPLTLANGFNPTGISIPNTFAIDPNFRVGYAHNWNASVQRDLPGGLVVIATYLGIKGTRAVQEFLPNTYPTGAVNPCTLCPAGFAYMASNGNSTRQSGELQLRRRMRSGFTASVDYTFSKAIDDAALGGKGQGTAVIAQNWLDLKSEKALSKFDQRHVLAAQFQYTTGMGVRGGTLLDGWRGTLFKDWTFAGDINAASGLPETPIYIAPVASTGVTGTIRPLYTGLPLYAAPPGLNVNPAAYTAPLPGQWGNAGRDTITGPFQLTIDASMSRTFRLTDKLNADLRFDSANPINHVTYTNWVTAINSAQFGLPAAANSMRTVRITVRVRF
jgi:hypothetical protein